jgi:phosphatidylglycerol:prolipoprotein diacylglycerol transferase
VIAALTVSFDPVFVLSDTASVRLETIGLAIVLFAALLLAARAASRSLVEGLRLDDLIFMAIGAVPGAIIGGRLGYVLDHLDYYRANPNAMLDPGQGALTLTLAVPLGLLTGSIIGRLLRAPIAAWMDALTPSLLFALAAGKLVGVLGASGQGQPTDLAWATAYLGAGPWGSLAAEVPSHPSQVYEAILVGGVVVAVALLGRTRWLSRGDGATLFVALGLWAAARFVAAFSWRDPAVAGPLRMEQLLLVGVGIMAAAGLWLQARSRRRATALPAATPASEAASTPAPEPAADVEADPA